VRSEPGHVDSFLFPETAAVLEAHAGEKLKPILVTRDYQAGDAVRHAGTERVYGSKAWKRADGHERSKTCDWCRVAYVASGPGQGEAFMACINKDKCLAHWADRARAKKQRQRAVAKAVAKGEEPRTAQELERKKQQEEEARRAAEDARWKKAAPAIWSALAEAVKKAPTRAGGLLAQTLIRGVGEDRWMMATFQREVGLTPEVLVPRGKTTEDLVRHAAFLALVRVAVDDIGFEGEALVKQARAFGVDVQKILDQAAPVQTPAKPGAKVKKAAKK